MILIAESGSTKTEWIGLGNGPAPAFHIRTDGINPYFATISSLHETLSEVILRTKAERITKLYFYGPGCSQKVMSDKLKNMLQSFFPTIETEIATDLLAAGRGLLGNKSGIICISGTGSNTGLYNGTDIIFSPLSGGYIFGDEGSGAHIGKKFITDFLNNELPLVLKEHFCEKYKLSPAQILENVYSKQYPSRFLSGFTVFIHENIGMAYCRSLVDSSFDAFFDKRLSKFKDFDKQPIKFTGSVAFYFKDILVKVAERYSIKLDSERDICKSPSKGLLQFHLSKS